jgi:eukaryotic-like serine/threonine-protein kinase
MSEQDRPGKYDVVLGGQNPPPLNAAVLGGVVGAKRKLANELGFKNELAAELIQTHDIFSFETVSVTDHSEVAHYTRKNAFYYTEKLENDITIDLIYIPTGSFIMGSPEEVSDDKAFERFKPMEIPQHLVNISSFYMAKYPTTQEQYYAIMGENPSDFSGNNLPVEQVTWHKAKEYCRKLSQKTGKNYALPSESQWEYACRAGTNTLFSFGDRITTDIANYNGKFTYKNHQLGLNRNQTTEVDKFPPNGFGIYDLHGNVCEWCEDTYHPNYEGAPTDGKPWIEEDLPDSIYPDYEHHNLRGGSWFVGLCGCRSASRFSGSSIPNTVGFRVVCF